jgi:hypothetical protein
VSALRGVVSDLREKRLWVLAAVLLIALVAIPVLLSSGGGSPGPGASSPPGVAATPAVPRVPAVQAQANATSVRLTGHGRDPFTQQVHVGRSTATVSSTGSGPSANTYNPTRPAAPSTGTRVQPSGSTSPGKSSGSSPTSPSAPRLRYYRFAVSLVFRRVGGRQRRIADAQRDLPLPSAKAPVILYLGLQNDERTSVFMVSSSASVLGHGSCRPSRSDCTFLYLKVGQVASVVTLGRSGAITQYTLEVTRIRPIPVSAPKLLSAARPRERAQLEHASFAGQRILGLLMPYVPELRSLRYSPSGLLGSLRLRPSPAAS